MPGSTKNGRASVRGSSKLRSSVGSSGGLLGGFKKVRSDMQLDTQDRNSSPDQTARKGTARPRFNVEGENISDVAESQNLTQRVPNNNRSYNSFGDRAF